MALTEPVSPVPAVETVGVDDDILLGILHEELPRAFWRRFRALRERLDREGDSEAARQALLPLIDQMETFNARRMAALAELARRRQLDPVTLMSELKVAPLQIPA